MAFTRKFLTDHGVPEEQVDAIMAERNRTLSDYIPKSDMQSQIDAAIAEAQKTAPVNVTESDEYKALLSENAKIKAYGSDDFSAVKKPYRDIVWDKLDHGEKAKPIAEQITSLKESMPDLFVVAEPPAEPNKPQFGAPTQGSMPSGDKGKSFMDTWNFVPKK